MSEVEVECLIEEHEGESVTLVCLQTDNDQDDRLLCMRCSLTEYFQNNLKNIVLIKDVQKKQQLYQFLKNDEKLKEIYNVTKRLSTDESPLIKEVKTLFTGLRTAINDKINNLETDFITRIEANHSLNLENVRNLHSKLNEQFNLGSLKTILTSLFEGYQSRAEANKNISEFSKQINEKERIHMIYNQYLQLQSCNKFVKLDSTTFKNVQNDMLKLIQDFGNCISESFIEIRSPEFWSQLYLKNSFPFIQPEGQPVIKFTPNIYNEKNEEVLQEENTYTLNYKKTNFPRCIYSEQFDKKDQMFFKIRVYGDIKEFMFNISTWEERNGYYMSNKTGNLIYSQNNSNSYQPVRQFKQLGNRTLVQRRTEIAQNQSWYIYVYINVENNVFLIMDESKTVYYSSQITLEKSDKWFFGITSASNFCPTIFEIMCGRKI